MRPWLSILMPTYQGEAFLPATLDGLVAERSTDFELLVVDDGSTDRTQAILDAYASVLPIRRVEGPRRGNWVASTNAALAEARGELASLLHQDDLYLPGRIDAMRRLVAEHPSAALWVHAARFVDDRGRVVGEWTLPLPAERSEVSSAEALERLLVQNWLAIPSPVFRVRDARSLGGLDESLWYTADWDFWLGLARRGPMAYVRRSHAAFRVHDASQTVTRSRDADAFREQMTRVLDRHLAFLEAPAATRASVERAARLAIEVNVALATGMHGRLPDPRRLGRACRDLGIRDVGRFVHDSRIAERVRARVATLLLSRLRDRRSADG